MRCSMPCIKLPCCCFDKLSSYEDLNLFVQIAHIHKTAMCLDIQTHLSALLKFEENDVKTKNKGSASWVTPKIIHQMPRGGCWVKAKIKSFFKAERINCEHMVDKFEDL